MSKEKDKLGSFVSPDEKVPKYYSTLEVLRQAPGGVLGIGKVRFAAGLFFRIIERAIHNKKDSF